MHSSRHVRAGSWRATLNRRCFVPCPETPRTIRKNRTEMISRQAIKHGYRFACCMGGKIPESLRLGSPLHFVNFPQRPCKLRHEAIDAKGLGSVWVGKPFLLSTSARSFPTGSCARPPSRSDGRNCFLQILLIAFANEQHRTDRDSQTTTVAG